MDRLKLREARHADPRQPPPEERNVSRGRGAAFEEAVALIRSGEGQVLTDSIHTVARSMETLALSLLREHEERETAIARGIVQLHGGRLWVESELGKGSTFTLPRGGGAGGE